MPSIRNLTKRLLLTTLVALVVIELGIHLHWGAPLTTVAALVACFASNFLVPRG